MAGVYDDTLTYITGEPIRGGTVTVYIADDTTEATLLDPVDQTTTIANPQTTSDVGRVSFAAQNGTYDLRVQTPYGEWTIEDVVISGAAGGFIDGIQAINVSGFGFVAEDASSISVIDQTIQSLTPDP